MIDSLALAITLLATDGRAQPLQGIEIRPTVWQVERASKVSKPMQVAALDTRPTVKVAAPSIWGE